MTADPDPESVLYARLRSWSLRSWGHGDRVAEARAAGQRLADLGAAAESRPARPVPDVGVHALVDQLVVLTADARRAGAPASAVDEVVAGLATRLGVGRPGRG